MATITRSKDAAPEAPGVTIVGGAWVHEVKSGSNAGKEFLSIGLDKGLKLSLNDADPVFLFPRQNFRPGKKDSDYLVCIQNAA